MATPDGKSISLRGIRWHQCVHCPRESGIVFGAEFLANEINDIFTVWQFRPSVGFREIRSVRLHAVVLQPLPGGVIRIAADGDDLQGVSGQIRSMFGQYGQRGTHLASSPKDHQWTDHVRDEIAQGGGRMGEGGIQCRLVTDDFRRRRHHGLEKWSERGDSNTRPPVPKTGALTRLCYAPNAPLIRQAGSTLNDELICAPHPHLFKSPLYAIQQTRTFQNGTRRCEGHGLDRPFSHPITGDSVAVGGQRRDR